MHRVLRFPRPDLAAGRHPGMRATTGPFAWLALGCALLLLTGCPLFGGKDGNEGAAAGKRNNPAFEVTLQGEGVSETGPLAYRVDLVTTAGPGQPLELSATLDGKPLALAQPPTSSEPEVVRVDGPDRLTALKPGNARITVVHQDNRAEVVVVVEQAESQASGFRVVKTVMTDVHGPVDAFSSDNYKYGNGGMMDLPRIWATIKGPDGKPVAGEQCRLFGARVSPGKLSNGWPEPKGSAGSVVFKEVLPGHDYDDQEMEGCGFQISGDGFPLIGGGVQDFTLDIHWRCLTKAQLSQCGTPGYPPCAASSSSKTCGSPLPGGSVKFGIKRQSPEECSYCKGR